MRSVNLGSLGSGSPSLTTHLQHLRRAEVVYSLVVGVGVGFLISLGVCGFNKFLPLEVDRVIGAILVYKIREETR